MRRESHVRFCEGGGVRLPSATRLVRSVKDECLNRVVPLGEWHLRQTLHEFATLYHRERNHQGLANELIERPASQRPSGVIRRRQPVGGILSYYYRRRRYGPIRGWDSTSTMQNVSIASFGRYILRACT